MLEELLLKVLEVHMEGFSRSGFLSRSVSSLVEHG